MFKSILMSAAIIGLTAPALAAPLPAPPSEAYVEPTQNTCMPVTIRVYFQNGEAMLSSHARDVVDETRTRLEGCAILNVDMVAVSADARTYHETSELSQERLAIVSAVLEEEGLLTRPAQTEIRTEFANTPIRKPMSRRVDVTLAAYNPSIG